MGWLKGVNGAGRPTIRRVKEIQKMRGSFLLYKFYLKLIVNRALFPESWGEGGSKGSDGPKWIKFLNSCRTMGGSRGQRGRNGSNSLIRAEQWGGAGVRGAKMD